MLLFMIETHLDYLKQLLRKLRLKKFFKMLIDIVTIFINFRNSRPAHKSAIRAYHPVAQAVIITVEEVGKIRMVRSEEHTSELQSRGHLVCRLLLEKKKKRRRRNLL